GWGAAARLRGGGPGRVLGCLLRLLVGGGRVAARPVAVPGRGPRRVRGRGGHGGALGAAPGRGRAEPGAGRPSRRVLARGRRHPAAGGRPGGGRRGGTGGGPAGRARAGAGGGRGGAGGWGGAKGGGGGKGPGRWPGRGRGTRACCPPSYPSGGRVRRTRSRFPGSCRCRRS